MPNPYIAGAPVKGESFYGREELLNHVLNEKNQSAFCVIGSRRFGKTSFLRQLEFLSDAQDSPYFPFYWNLEGGESKELLRKVFRKELLLGAARIRLRTLSIDPAPLAASSELEDMIVDLCGAANDHGKKLLLLCDECEWLIPIGQQDPALLARLRNFMQTEGVRTVVAGSRRLAEINSIPLWSSSFLHGFEPIKLLPRLSETDAASLICQSKSTTEHRLNLPQEVISGILTETNCHPYLIQAICFHLWDKSLERENLLQAYEKAFQGFSDQAFTHDFSFLAPAEKKILFQVWHEEEVSDNEGAGRLEDAGYLKWADKNWRLASPFFQRWLESRSNSGTLDSIDSRISDRAAERLHNSVANQADSSTSPQHFAASATADTRTGGFERWAGGKQVTLALAFTDIVGSTLLGHELGNAEMNAVRRAHFAQARSLINKHGGFEIKTVGDAFMIAFRTAVASLNFALDLYAATGDARVLVRAGIHVGQVSIEEGDAFGTMVNYTSRVIGMASGAEIWLSERAFEDIEQERAVSLQALSWTEHADCDLKGLPGIHRLWSLTTQVLTTVTGNSAANEGGLLARKIANGEFDVFLCHNSVNKAAVKAIGQKLKAARILPWLDEWELRPGLPWQRLLEQQIGQIKAAAVFVGSDGIGPWQRQELDAFLREFANRGCPVIPVLLPDEPGILKTQEPAPTPDLPLFLKGMMWVDFRNEGSRDEGSTPIEDLIWGITGEKPSRN